MATIVQDDGVREIHGVAKADGANLIRLTECGNRVEVSTCGYSSVTLSLKNIRYLAKQLNRLARRIEQREPPPA